MGEILVKAMLFGKIEGLDPSTLFLYQRMGLFHLFSASGYHMAAALFVAEQGGKILSVTRISASTKASLLLIVSIGLMTFFGHATEWSSPMVRAYAMASLILFAQYFGLKPHKPQLFAGALLVSALFGNSGPLSFLLSGLAMAGILLTAGKGWLVMALAPWLFTLPVVLWHFSLLNPMAVLWNLFGLILGWIILPLSVLSLLLERIVDLYFLPGALMELFHGALIFLSKFDLSFWVRREIILLALVLAIFSKKNKFLPLGIFIAFMVRIFLVPTYAALDVNQGDSFFLETTDRQRWLVDVGPRGPWASGALEKIGLGSLDHILISHLDLDHRGGIDSILARHKVGTLWMRIHHLEQNKSLEIIEWAERAQIPVRAAETLPLSFPCWLPPAGQSSNESSIVCQPKILDGRRVCLMADAGVSTEFWLLWSRNWGQCDLIKIGHHGSRGSTSLDFLRHIKAKEAILSCGKKNRYGHPHREVLERLSDQKVFVYRTDEKGTISDSLWTRFVARGNQIRELLLGPFEGQFRKPPIAR